MTRALFLTAIHCGRLMQGETLPVERYLIAPGCILICMLIFGGFFS